MLMVWDEGLKLRSVSSRGGPLPGRGLETQVRNEHWVVLMLGVGGRNREVRTPWQGWWEGERDREGKSRSLEDRCWLLRKLFQWSSEVHEHRFKLRS